MVYNKSRMPELYSAATSQTKDQRDFLPKPRGNSLSSLLVLPSSKVHFQTQEPEEKILMILRAHWITNLPWLILAAILFFAPVVLFFTPFLPSFPLEFRLIFFIGWYLILLMYVFQRFLSWFFNLSIITDERIIDVDFYDVTVKKVSDADIDKIQDVTFTNAGALGAVFNYGDVLVQTASEITEFVFNKVPDPAKVADILQRLRTEEKKEALEGRLH